MWYPKIINTDMALYKAIADALEKDIHKGVLKAGDRMPPQRKLAEKIGVNLTTITRAYKEAHQRNLIEARKGDGTFIRHFESTQSHYMETPPLIELGFVNPGTSDIQPIMKAMKRMTSREGLKDIFGYVESQGLKRHRRVASKWLEQYGFRNVNANHVVITSGATNAINCILLSHFKSGDLIATDALTFAGFKQSASLHGIKLIPVKGDQDGMDPNALKNLCLKEDIKGLYLMPNMQNPTATTMSDRRKESLAKLIEAFDLTLIEDDIFAYTNLETNMALSSLVPKHSYFICGISKLLYPGLRIAFVKVPEHHVKRFINALVHTVWMASPISAEILTQLIETGDIYGVASHMRATIALRQMVARDILKPYKISDNHESMYLWLELPSYWLPESFEKAALRIGVNVISAGQFTIPPAPVPNAIRIAITTESDDFRFKDGLMRIKELLDMPPSDSLAIM